jgi:hypothetical protein
MEVRITLSWENEKTPNLSIDIGCIHKVGYAILIISSNKIFPLMILVSCFPERLFGHYVDRIVLKDTAGAELILRLT